MWKKLENGNYQDGESKAYIAVGGGDMEEYFAEILEKDKSRGYKVLEVERLTIGGYPSIRYAYERAMRNEDIYIAKDGIVTLHMAGDADLVELAEMYLKGEI